MRKTTQKRPDSGQRKIRFYPPKSALFIQSRFCGSAIKGHIWKRSITAQIHAAAPFLFCKNEANALFTLHSELLAKWDTKQNGNIAPSSVHCMSNVQYHWICPNGHFLPHLLRNGFDGIKAVLSVVLSACSIRTRLRNGTRAKTRSLLMKYPHRPQKQPSLSAGTVG